MAASRTLATMVTAFLLGSSIVGCSAFSSDGNGADETTEASQDELRSVASGFFVRSPLSGARMEHLRTELLNADDGYSWVRNQGNAFGMQWETSTSSSSSTKRVLTAAERTAIAQAAFASQLGGSRRSYLKSVKVVAPTDADLGKALDAIGLEASMQGETETDKQRTKLMTALSAAAKTRSITVLSAKLEYQVDMYWEGALVVIDEDNKQIIFATGGYGT